MSVTFQERSRGLLAIITLAVAGAGAAFGCSGDASPGDDGGHPVGRGRWALHVDVGPQRHRVDFVPDEVAGTGATSPPFPRALKTMALESATAQVSASKLLLGAATMCGLENSEVASDVWADGGWFVFRKDPATCDELLRYEQVTTCVADKLAEIAEAVNVVRWDNVPPIDGLPKPWFIRPQSDLDRFIARDLAIYTLGNLAQLDGTRLDPHANFTCGPSYVDAQYLAQHNEKSPDLRTGRLFDAASAKAIGLKVPDAAPTDPKYLVEADPLLGDRVQLQVMTLRAATHLLHDLVEDNVYADMSGAAHRAGQASDPAQANREIWGEEDPYNSLAHAMRVLAGRWEGKEPRCGSDARPITSMTLLESLHDEVAMRKADLPVGTPGQADAASIIARAGILIDTKDLADATLRAVVKNQLLTIAADQAGVLQNGQRPAGFESTPDGLRTVKTLEGVSDGDLRFGLDHVARTFRLVTRGTVIPTSAGGWPTAQTTTLVPYEYIAAELQPLGSVVKGGLGRELLPVDVTGRVYGAIASECRGAPEGWDEAVFQESEHHRENPRVFQDSFAIARAMSNRFIDMEYEFLDHSGFDKHPARATLRQSIAEMRPWAGGGSVSIRKDVVDTVTTFSVDLTGFTKEELGLSSFDPDEVAKTLAMADDGECAARLRADCPAIVPRAITPGEVSTSTSRFGTKIVLTIKSSETNFRLPAWLFSRRGYAGRGMLVAPLYGTYLAAPMRAELTNKLFAFASDERAHDPRVGDRGAGRSDAYCLKGVPRDVFVPLENELTSQGNETSEESWKHYLTAAQSAAERADALGEKLLELGTAQDTRREKAAADLGQLCGDISSLQQLEPRPDGTIDTSHASESLKVCLKEPQCDVVFLSQKETVDANELKELLRCDLDSSGDVCSRLNKNPNINIKKCDSETVKSNKDENITFASLQLFRFNDPNRTSTSCAPVAAVSDGLRGGGGFSPGAAGNLLSQRWALSDQLPAAAFAMQMRVSPTNTTPCDPDPKKPCETRRVGQWSVVAGGTLMESDVATSGLDLTDNDPPLWPSCLRGNPQNCKFDDPKSNARLLNNLFRSRCPGGASRESCALGAPEGGSEMAEVNILRWRVQGALWMLGMLGGTVGEGAVVTPIPAANFTAVNKFMTPLSTIYGNSFFDADGKLDTTGADDHASTPADREALGPTLPVQGSALATWGGSASKLPDWYRKIYKDLPPQYRLVVGVENAEENYKDDDPGFPGWIIDSGRLQAIARSAEGAKCPDYDGRPGGKLADLAAQDQLVARLALIKNAWSKDDLTATTGQAGAWFSPAIEAGRNAEQLNDNGRFFRLDEFFVHYDPGHNAYYEVLHWFKNKTPEQGSLYVGDTRKDRPTFVSCNAPTNPQDDDGWYYGRIYGNENCRDAYDHGRYAWKGDPGDTFNTEALAMPPRRRARAFLNSGAAADACSALSEFVGAYGLACSVSALDAGNLAPAVLPKPPSIEAAHDIVRFRRWLTQLTLKVRERASKYYVQSVPLRAIDDLRAQQVARGTIKGLHGDTVVQIENTLNALGTDWATIVDALNALNNDLQATEKMMAGLKKESDARAKVLSLQLAQAIVADSANVISGIASIAQQNYAGIGNVVGGAGGIVMSTLINNAQQDVQKAQLDNQVLDQMIKLSTHATDTISQASKMLTALRTDANNISSMGNNLRYQQDLAAYYAAQGSGADYVKTSSGTPTLIPLNTVLRRQFAGTRNRYLRALQDAKGLAYIARRAIEQRLGVSMSDVHEAVGPLEAPSTWADSICHLTGIDYSKLRTVGSVETDAGTVLEPSLGDGGFDRQVIGEFSDAFVGDYVARLRNFVDFYNIQFPSHEADDTAVLSVREDFLPRSTACVLPAPNLLYYSSQLQMQAMGKPPQVTQPGWEYTPCASPQKCVVAEAARGYPDSLPPVDAARSHVTILSDRPFPAPPTDDAPAKDSRPGRVVKGVKDAPAGYVAQVVVLEKGTYALSWWDQARTPTGAQDAGTSPNVPYRVAVFQEKPDPAGTSAVVWDTVAFDDSDGDSSCDSGSACLARVPTTNQPWSSRHVRTFEVPVKATYHVAFAASREDVAVKGAVAIAGVQLESVVKKKAATAYVETTLRRENYGAVCPAPTAKELQASFTRSCDDNTATCYYDLEVPILMDEVALQRGQSSLSTKIARGNFNYRHTDMAVNLVGNKLHDCPSGAPTSCTGSQFTAYSLFHDAQQVPILDWSGAPHYFDFGTGRVERGKALSANKIVALPFEPEVQGMLGLPGIQRLEYRGRPLDGRYRLRIWDDPALQWSRLDDVQILLRYRYWSKVDRPSGTR